MIRSFQSRKLQRFWVKGEIRQVDSRHAAKLRRQLATLDAASSPEGMNLPGWRFHRRTGVDAGRFSVWVDQNWRLTFAWAVDGPDAVEVNYEDYH